MSSQIDNEKRARVIIGEILNLALNRHIHVLVEAGYLDYQKYSKEPPYIGGEPGPTLRLKYALVDEICLRLGPSIRDYLEHPREDLWPLHDPGLAEGGSNTEP
jgi:hypothetical protein